MEKYQIVRETNLTGKNLYEQSLLNAELDVNTIDMLAKQVKQINAFKTLLRTEFKEDDSLKSLYDLISVYSTITIIM